MNAADPALAMLRGDVIDIVLGTVFLTIGATAAEQDKLSYLLSAARLPSDGSFLGTATFVC